MTDTNVVTVAGRMVHDIGEKDFGYVGETAKLKISIAVNRSKKANGEWINEVSYFDIVYWGKPAEAIKQYLGKGKQLIATGSLQQDRWTGKDGKNASKIYINATSIQLLGGKSEGSAPQSAPAPQANDDEGFQEDLPF